MTGVRPDLRLKRDAQRAIKGQAERRDALAQLVTQAHAAATTVAAAAGPAETPPGGDGDS